MSGRSRSRLGVVEKKRGAKGGEEASAEGRRLQTSLVLRLIHHLLRLVLCHVRGLL